MADDAPAEGTAPTDAAPSAGKTFTQADVDRVVGDRLAREREKYAGFDEYKSAAEKLKELEEGKRSDIEKLTRERDKHLTASERSAAENLRLRIAMEKKLPAKWVDRLKGATREDMEKDADEILADLAGPQTGFDGGVRGQATKPGDMDQMIRKAAGYA